MISGFRREVDWNALFWVTTQQGVVISYRRFVTIYRTYFYMWTILGYYAASSGNFLPTLRDNLSASLKMGPTGCYENLVRNYHYWLCNNLEELGSYNRSYTCWSVVGR